MTLQLGLFDDAPLTGEYPLTDAAFPGTCRSCDAPIAWAHTEAGKAIPLSLATARTIGGVRYALTHFTDCPNSREWRKTR